MTALQIAQHLNGRKTGRGKWMAKCPAHDDHKPSLIISEGRTGVLLACMSHQCDFLDIVRSSGLKPLMLRYDYNPSGQFDRKAYAEAHRKARAEEAKAYRSRIREWIKLFRAEGYSTQDRDAEVVCAVAQIMAAEGSKPHLEAILATHMERITAASLLEEK